MKHGLTDSLLIDMDAVFRRFPAISRVVLFGSRATGTYRPGSDIDLAIEGEGVRFKHIIELHLALEDIGSLYKFDLLNMHGLANEALQDHVRRVGISIFEQQKQVPAE